MNQSYYHEEHKRLPEPDVFGKAQKNLLSCCFVTGIGLILLSELLMNIFSIRDVIIQFSCFSWAGVQPCPEKKA